MKKTAVFLNSAVFLFEVNLFLKYFKNLFIYLVVLDLCLYVGISLVAANKGYSLVVVHRLLIAGASLLEELGL